MESDLVPTARRLASSLLSPLNRRWLHVQGVANRAESLTSGLKHGDCDILVAAAWLHDIGYAPIGDSGFHPLDGARFLQTQGFPEVVVGLVAYHSGALFEAHERHLEEELLAYVMPLRTCSPG